MKKIFKSLIPFFIIAIISVFILPVWAITMNGCATTAMQGCSPASSTTLNVLAAEGGQSLAAGLFTSAETGSRIGADNFEATIINAGSTVTFVNGATGGSFASKNAAAGGPNHWWDTDLDVQGPAMTTFKSAVTNSGITPNVLLWSQGEADSDEIFKRTTKAEYKSALTSIFNDVRTTYGNMPVVIQRLGRRNTEFTTGGGQIVRDVQFEMAAENSWVYLGPDSYDLDLFDNVHLKDSPGYAEMGTRLANRTLDAFGETIASSVGPSISSATRSGTTVTVNLTHDSGTDFTPATGHIEGFRFFNNTAQIDITNAVRTNATTATLTLESVPSGTETLYYVYDTDKTLFGSGRDQLYELFTTDPGWAVVGTSVVTGGKSVSTVVGGGADRMNTNFSTALTEAWASFKLQITGVSLPNNGDQMEGSGFSNGGGRRLGLGVINDSGTIRYSLRNDLDSGNTNTIITAVAFNEILEVDVELYWKSATGPGNNDGIVRAYINGTLCVDITDADTDATTIPSFLAGNLTSTGTTAGVFSVDDVRVGTTNALSRVLKDNAATVMPLQSYKAVLP